MTRWRLYRFERAKQRQHVPQVWDQIGDMQREVDTIKDQLRVQQIVLDHLKQQYGGKS